MTKIRFENLFEEKLSYERQTRDDNHLSKIINALKFQKGDKVLDLGTGTGYIAFTSLASSAGFKTADYFMTEIRFPSGSRTEGYREIEHTVPSDLKESYDIEIIDDEVYITEKFLNISFLKPLS